MRPRLLLTWSAAIVGLCIAVGHLLADQVVLVPGTIAGTVAVGTLPISQIQINATPQSGTTTSFVTNPNPNIPNAPYSMTVSVAQTGTTTFTVQAFARTDQNRDLLRFASVSALVSASTPAQQDFSVVAPGFIDPTFTVTGGATISSVSLNASFSSGSIFEQASTSAPATANFIFAAIPRNGMSLTGSVLLSNGLQVQLPARTIDVVANQTTSVAYTVDGTASGSIGGVISFPGPLSPDRLDVSANGPTSKSIIQQPPAPTGLYSVGPLMAGNGYSLNATARFNNFDDTFAFPNAAYAPSRSNLAVGSAETTVNVSAQQAFINGTVQLTGAASLLPFVSSGFVFVTGANSATSGGSSQDQLSVATRAFDLIVSPGPWRFSQTTVSFFRPAPFLSGNFSFFDNRPTATTTVAVGETAAVDVPIALGEVTLTITVAGGGTLSNPSVSGSCVQRDDLNAVLWQSSFSFSTSGQNNVTQGTVTYASPSGQCTMTPRAVINGQTVVLPASTVQVIAGSSQTVDVGGPTLTITTPAPEAIVGTNSIFVSGKASDDIAVASVTVNGVATNLSSAGNPNDPPQVNFSTVSAIPLQRGPNLLTTVAKDSATPQNTTTDTRTVYWDTALPTLSFTPATGFSTLSNSVMVSGTANDDAGVKKITINGVDTTFSSTSNPAFPHEVSFSGTASLVVGSNPITVVVTDISNRTTTQTHTVTRQQQAATTLTVAAASATYGGTVNLSATLLSQGNGVGGKTIHFTLNGNSADGTTNANGVATVSGMSTSGLDVSAYPGAITALFAGDADFLTSSGSATLTITKATASLTLGNLSQTYDGTSKAASVTTGPSGLTGVTVTYDGSSTAPTGAGSYAVAASLTNANYDAPNATGTLVINKATATLTLGALTHIYDGSPKAATVTTSPAGLSGVSVTYEGSPTTPTGANSYAVIASLTNTNYEAPNATGTLVINKATATLSLSNLMHTFDGSSKAASATSSPAGLSGVSLTYDGSATAPTNAGSYAVVASLTNANYDAPNATGTLVISKVQATLTLGTLTHTYDASPKAATVTTSPAGLSGVSITYDATSTAPTNTGNYAVVASLTNANYEAPNATGTLVISKAPATLTLANLSHTYNGSPKPASATSIPAGLSGVSLTYDGLATTPTNAGNYAVVASLTNSNYEAPDASAMMTIGKADQTIAFGAPGNKTFGDPDFVVSATVTSGLAVSFSALSGACTVAGSSVHLTGAGSCTIRASQAGDNNYNVAPNVDQSFAIGKANQAIAVTVAAPPSAIYTTTFNTVATGGGSVNPVVITAAGTCSVSAGGSGTATVQMNSGTGTCSVYYNQAGNSNYNAASQVVAVTAAQKASQTIAVTTSAPATAAYNSSFTVAATGGGSGNAIAYTTPTGDGCSDTGPTFTVTSGVSACQILYNQAGNANYSAASQVTQSVTPVGYVFNGFFEPIDMSSPTITVWNKATAGQAIPVKWRLTLNGVPVSALSSFVGLLSNEVSCTTGADVEDAIEEYAPGASGLTYDGDGNFHFNWKTPAAYKNKCRAMYVSFSDGSSSKVASFRFK